VLILIIEVLEQKGKYAFFDTLGALATELKRANGGHWMCKFGVKLGLFLFVGFFIWWHIPLKWIEFSGQMSTNICFGQSQPEESPEETDIEWFREEMKISSKYLEIDEGILGLSWTHFLTMFFLLFFFIAGVTALVMRQRRTKQLLNQLLKEAGRNGAHG